MKFLSVLLIAFAFTTSTKAQNGQVSADGLLFEKALLAQELAGYRLDLKSVIDAKNETPERKSLAKEIETSLLETSLEFYEELIANYPTSSLLFRAMNNKGFIELHIEDTLEAKRTFNAILKSKANDKEKGGAGVGIMAEPYTNYKNKATKALAEIHISEGKFKEAIAYMDETKKFPYRHFCGNAYAEEEIYMKQQYARCYIGLKNENKALEILLPEILPNGLADNDELVEMTFALLLKTYSKDSLRTEFENALNNFTSETGKSKSDATPDYILFLNTRISVPYLYGNEVEKKEQLREMCAESRIYRLLKEDPELK